MKRIGIQVEETNKYEDEMVVIQPDGMTDEEFESLLDKAEKDAKSLMGGTKDFAYALSKWGLEVEEQEYSFPDSPRDTEFEVFNVREMKGSG